MKKMIYAICLVLAVILVTDTFAKTEYKVVDPNVYAKMWRKFSERERSIYMTGAIIGMLSMCYETIMGSEARADKCDSDFKEFAQNNKNTKELRELLDFCYVKSQCENLSIYHILGFWYGEKDVPFGEKKAALKLLSDDPKLFPQN